eukprot:1152615-Pelagomonas_calceolata.AAC.1
MSRCRGAKPNSCATALGTLSLEGWETGFLCDGLHLTPEGNAAAFKALMDALKDRHPELMQTPRARVCVCVVCQGKGSIRAHVCKAPVLNIIVGMKWLTNWKCAQREMGNPQTFSVLLECRAGASCARAHVEALENCPYALHGVAESLTMPESLLTQFPLWDWCAKQSPGQLSLALDHIRKPRHLTFDGRARKRNHQPSLLCGGICPHAPTYVRAYDLMLQPEDAHAWNCESLLKTRCAMQTEPCKVPHMLACHVYLTSKVPHMMMCTSHVGMSRVPHMHSASHDGVSR